MVASLSQFIALRDGARYEQLAEVIRERYGMSSRRAELIARDQMGSLVSKLNQEKQQQVGVEKYRWRNSQDERVVGNPSGKYPEPTDPAMHGDHWAREGQVFSWSDAPEDGHPGEAINCRCTAEPVWEFDGEEFEDDADETPTFPTAKTLEARAGREPTEIPEGHKDRKFGTHRGRASDRPFNRRNLVLDIERRTISDIEVNEEGLEIVANHISRFADYPPNRRMLERLRKIERGELELTEYDARFYTHELREYERYAAAGWETGVPDDPDERHELWNTQHTATLEEFGIDEKVYPLYHPAAEEDPA